VLSRPQTIHRNAPARGAVGQCSVGVSGGSVRRGAGRREVWSLTRARYARWWSRWSRRPSRLRRCRWRAAAIDRRRAMRRHVAEQ